MYSPHSSPPNDVEGATQRTIALGKQRLLVVVKCNEQQSTAGRARVKEEQMHRR